MRRERCRERSRALTPGGFEAHDPVLKPFELVLGQAGAADGHPAAADRAVAPDLSQEVAFFRGRGVDELDRGVVGRRFVEQGGQDTIRLEAQLSGGLGADVAFEAPGFDDRRDVPRDGRGGGSLAAGKEEAESRQSPSQDR